MAVVQGDVLETTATMKMYASITLTNVYHHVAESVSDGDNETVFDDMNGLMCNAYAELQDILSTSLVTDQITVYNVTQDLPVGQGPWSTWAGGGSPIDPVASGVAFVVRLIVNAKRGQGRKFIGGIVESMTTGGVWTATALTDMAAYMGHIITNWEPAISGNVYAPHILRRSTGETFPILGGILNAIPGYQRRRKEGVGE